MKTNIETEHISSVYIIKATASDDNKTETAIEAVDLATLKGEGLAIAIREASETAKRRAVTGLQGEVQKVEGPKIATSAEPKQPALISNVVEIRGNWQCSRNRQITVLKLWNKALELGVTELELRDVLKGFHVTSRKELKDSQADELIKFLSETINSLLKSKKEATQ